jgi:5'-methylthioadenosine phosphorylase
MSGATLAVIGGSGFYEMDGVIDVESVAVDTPFGAPSDSITLATVEGVRVAFLPRHGVGHRILPHELPSRANVWALASLGVQRIIAVSAVGSLQERMAPMDMVVPDQLIDRTTGRPSTFFGEGLAAHIAFDAPFCPQLSGALADAAAGTVAAHRGGTLVVIEGPAFSTRAESELYRSWGADVIGMTTLPEAKLAREARICYATLACVTDYDTWHPSHATVTADLIIENLKHNVANAQRIVRAVAAALPTERACACARSLDDAIVTPLRLVPPETLERLGPILEPVAARELEAAP